jgi:phage/plasmid primase-like uncharacterized protein
MTYSQQVISHINFLQSLGLVVEELTIGDFVRCRSVDDAGRNRGEYTYRTTRNPMARHGLIGLSTWARAPSGKTETYKTYGNDIGFDENPIKCPAKILPPKEKEIVYSEEITRRCREIWDGASLTGLSPYLETKKVASYGLRFLDNDYGQSAVVPARDNMGILRNLQFLNQNGQKRFIEGSTIVGLFHELQRPANGLILGIAESYATAASCLDVFSVPMICAFCSSNLTSIAKTFRARYPDSHILVFGDDDRHLTERGLENIGRKSAEKAATSITNSLAIFPDFGNISPAKDSSDWNDLVRLRGLEVARAQIKGLKNDRR